MKKFLVLLFVVSFISVDVLADNTASVEFAKAQALYKKREAFKNDEPTVDQTRLALDKALQANPSDELKYEILAYYSRVLVWQGKHTTTLKPEDVYDLAMQKADEARKLQGGSYDNYTEGHYFYAVALGRWALEKGPLNVLARTGEMMGALDDALNGDTLEGELGETYDYFGPDRVYGRLYMELPTLAGGDRKKARKHLEKAYTNAPEHSLNALYYAQVLDVLDETEEGCKVINELLSKQPQTMIPERVADATEDFKEAQQFQMEKCLSN